MRYLLPVVVLISHLPLALADIKPQWSLDLPARKPAWEHTQRMTPDSGYEPVTAGKLVFVGMETNGALIAIDAATGVEQWRFYTNAPIRWAPAVDDQRVYVGSDDGCLYCLDHAGKLMWKLVADDLWPLPSYREMLFIR